VAIMAIEILRPNAAGDLTQCEQYPGTGSNYQKVDEVIADDDSTYVYCEEDVTTTDLYNLSNSGIGAGTIIKVRVCVRAGADSSE